MKKNLNLIEELNKEFKGWKVFEIISLIFFFIVICLSAITLKDNPIAIINAICGVLYTVLAGKGKIYCYYFGLGGSSCYSYLSFQNSLFGNLLLYMCYYIPMQILGIFKWKKNLKENSDEIVKDQLSTKSRVILFSSLTIISIITSFVLKHFGDSQPFMDAITTIFSIAGMYLTVKRCIEQWLVWIVVNSLSLFMWINVVLNGTKAYATVVMWAFYLLAGIYFYFTWKKELNKN